MTSYRKLKDSDLPIDIWPDNKNPSDGFLKYVVEDFHEKDSFIYRKERSIYSMKNGYSLIIHELWDTENIDITFLIVDTDGKHIVDYPRLLWDHV